MPDYDEQVRNKALKLERKLDLLRERTEKVQAELAGLRSGRKVDPDSWHWADTGEYSARYHG